jgi:YidC/Oxa1 family membrane protein insertase
MVQKLMLYGIPLSLLVSGSLFPLGVVIYWVTQNFFSMGQQFWVLSKMPPPGAPKVDPEVARSLAPKPGVKPVNPKKGGRPAVTAKPSNDGAVTFEPAEVRAAKAAAAKANGATEGGADGKSPKARNGGASGTGINKAEAESANGAEPEETSDGDPAGAGARKPAPAARSGSGGGGRRPQDTRNRNRKRKGGRR